MARNTEDLGEIIEINADALRFSIEERDFTMREVTGLIHGIYVNPDYISKRLKKGSMPIDVLVEVCRVIGENWQDFVEPFDLRAVPSYQMIEELQKRGEIE
jgi:hypothetical protein